MKKYEIIFDHYIEIVKVEDWECEQDAIDKMIDMLENEGLTNRFLTRQEEKEYGEDKYVIGGNHGLALYHGGNFKINELMEVKV